MPLSEPDLLSSCLSFAHPALCSFIDRCVSAHAACELCGMRGMDSPRVNLPVPLPSLTRHPVIPGEAASRSYVVVAADLCALWAGGFWGEGRAVMVAGGGVWGDVQFKGWSLS